jgi:transposase-like protein
MPYSLFPVITRLRVTPDEPVAPDAIVNERPRGSRRPHTDLRVALVRRLIEQTNLTYSEIATKSGVGRASISRWRRDGGWRRPPFAPVATDTVPSARASQKLKLRKLAERLRDLAERHLRTLEADPAIDTERLLRALQVVKLARLEEQGRRRQRKPLWGGRAETGADTLSRDEAIRAALKEMRRGGVDLDHVPPEAMELLLDARMPHEDSPALRPRGRR